MSIRIYMIKDGRHVKDGSKTVSFSAELLQHIMKGKTGKEAVIENKDLFFEFESDEEAVIFKLTYL